MVISISALILAILALLFPLSVSVANSHEMSVKHVYAKEAVLEHKVTGATLHAKEGDDIGDGWKVVEIKGSHVTIEKEVGPREKLQTELPVERLRKINVGK